MDTLRHNEITLPIPNGWEDGTQVVVVSPLTDGFRPNVVVSQDPAQPDEDAAQYAQRQVPSLVETLEDYTVTAQGPAKLGPHSGFMREHSFLSNGERVAQLQFSFIVGKTAYTLTFTHLAELLDAARPTAESIFAAVEID